MRPAPHGALGTGAGNRCEFAEQHQQTGGAEREGRGDRDDAARRRKRRFERHDDQPDRGKRFDAAGRRGHRRDQPGQAPATTSTCALS